MIQLTLTRSYGVQFEDGTIKKFRFNGDDGAGKVIVESPPGSGAELDLFEILKTRPIAYWEIPE